MLQVDSLPAKAQGSPRILEWVAYPFSRGSSWPRTQTQIFRLASGFFTSWAIREAQSFYYLRIKMLICISYGPSMKKMAPSNWENFRRLIRILTEVLAACREQYPLRCYSLRGSGDGGGCQTSATGLRKGAWVKTCWPRGERPRWQYTKTWAHLHSWAHQSHNYEQNHHW